MQQTEKSQVAEECTFKPKILNKKFNRKEGAASGNEDG